MSQEQEWGDLLHIWVHGLHGNKNNRHGRCPYLPGRLQDAFESVSALCHCLALLEMQVS